MHEFSLATEVIRLAKLEAEKANAANIMEINIEVGDLSGVEADAFETAIGLLAVDSVLGKSAIRIHKTPGTGTCNKCNIVFEMNNRLATCPQCTAFPSEVKGGNEFRILSLLIE
jgi:hydrogenase nickel incorporation protein HypA/HybF